MSGDIQTSYGGPVDSTPPRTGGPATCPRPCIECSTEHHFADPMFGDAEDEPEHEAAKLGVNTWWVCKHCPAWREYDPDWDDEGDDLERGMSLGEDAVDFEDP
jgi:hypothetical protein